LWAPGAADASCGDCSLAGRRRSPSCLYERHGCVRQAEITDHPVGHSSIFLAKRLAGA